MKPLLFLVSFLMWQCLCAQSLDYLSVRKKSGRVVNNFYGGSPILLQTTDFSYLSGPIKMLRHDSLFINVYDVREYRTAFASVLRDTISVSSVAVHYHDIRRILLNRRRSFFQRNTGPLLMMGGGGYFLLNVLNGAIFNQSITDKRNLKILGVSAGAFGLGYLFQKFFTGDGFSKKSQRIVYVHL